MPPRKKLGEILLAAGLIDEYQLRSAIGHQKQWGSKLGSALVEMGFITEEQIASALEGQLSQKVVPAKSLVPDPAALAVMPMLDALRYVVLPLRINGNELILAMTNPYDYALVDEIGFKLGKRIRGVLAVESSIKKAIKKHYYADSTGRDYRVDVRPAAQSGTDPEIIHGGSPNTPSIEPSPTKKVEPSAELIAKGLAFLLIEKGIITKEELVEKMRSIK